MQAQDTFIQKKLLYRFDKKIETVFQSLFGLADSQLDSDKNKMIDEGEEKGKNGEILGIDSILQQIEWLQFQNFKYRAAVVSAKKDQTSNQQILKKAQQQISEAKKQVDVLSKELQYSLKCKRNKQQYNQIAESLKSNFEPLSVQKQKLDSITKEIQDMETKYQKEHLEYQKKQKCLRLALSALKSVIEDQSTESQQQIDPNTQSLLRVPVSSLGSSEKVSHQFSNPNIQNIEASSSGRQEGEQVEGGQILY